MIVPRKGRLPDLGLLARRIREVGDPFTLRGVEATVEGRLVRDKSRFNLELTGTGERVRLGPLTHKVQWDREAKREQPATPAEKNAYKALTAKWDGKPRLIRAVGPLVEQGKGKPFLLEVREFTWDPKAPIPAPSNAKENAAPSAKNNSK